MSAPMQDVNQLIDTTSLQDIENKFLTFFCDQQLFGVPISHIVQIVGMQEITSLPESLDYLKGIINLRGSIIPVIDTRLRLKKPEIRYDERTCIIITTIKDITTGFIVDGVDEVINVDPELIVPTPKSTINTENKYITGIATIQNKVILIMDIQKLFTSSEIELIRQ
ncbi:MULTISPECIES: chemotaxis protein CheW [unclassified Lacrimispora]|uniref:chemotaxis protein CheW n=1 Tax=unclassified Lacrimispora TaxID=2719232 RepID=UPI0037705282